MDPITGSVSALHATYQLILFSVDVDQVPSQVRRSLELVQTCHRDLQHLIEIRNECLPLLDKTPIVLNRVNEIIAAANQGLLEVCQIVEKCRPDANNGRVPFKNRVAWVMFDSREFRAQEPVISRHHAAVLSELNFLRQTALLAPHLLQFQQPQVVVTGQIKKQTEIFDNVALLGGLMGEMALSGTTPYHTSSSSTEAAARTPPTSTEPKSIGPFPQHHLQHPPRHPTYPPTSNPAKHHTPDYESFCELEAPIDPSFRSTTPRPKAVSQPTVQHPILGLPLAEDDNLSRSLTSGLGLLSLQHSNQTRDSLLDYSSTASTLNLHASPRFPDFTPSHQAVPSLSSTPAIRIAHDAPSTTSPDALPEQPSEPGELEKGGPTKYSRLAGYLRRNKDAKSNSLGLKYGGSSVDLRHTISSEDLIPPKPARSGTTSSSETRTGRWFSPDSVHVFSGRNSSTATVNSEASTLIPPSPSFTSFPSVSALSLSTRPSETSLNVDVGFKTYPAGDPPTQNVHHEPPCPPMQPRHAFTEPSSIWKPAERPGIPKSVTSRSQSESTNPTIIFGSPFWSSEIMHASRDSDPSLKRSHTDGEGDLGRTEAGHHGTAGLMPTYRGKHMRNASSQSDLTSQNKTSTPEPPELSSINYVPEVAELP